MPDYEMMEELDTVFVAKESRSGVYGHTKTLKRNGTRNQGAWTSTSDHQEPEEDARKSSTADTQSFFSCYIPAFLLVLLAVQNCSQYLLMRVVRESSQTSDSSLLSSVFLQEVIKTVVSFGMLAWYKSSFYGAMKLFVWDTFTSWEALGALAIPAVLYLVQNLLLYFALTYLEAATAQVLYQAKILTTAVFSVVMLGRKFSGRQWIALAFLCLGAAIVQHSLFHGDSISFSSATYTENIKGIVAIMMAVVTSGFCGCYVERVIKTASNSGACTGELSSVWLRNLQLSFTSKMIAAPLLVLQHYNRQSDFGMGILTAKTSMEWAVIFDVSVGGLLTSLVSLVEQYHDGLSLIYVCAYVAGNEICKQCFERFCNISVCRRLLGNLSWFARQNI